MSDPVEEKLTELVPRGADRRLRGRVLRAVSDELALPPVVSWDGRAAWVVAASILLGLALNAWIANRHQVRMAQLYGPPAEPKVVQDVVDAVRVAADDRAAEHVRRQLAGLSDPASGAAPSICSVRYVDALEVDPLILEIRENRDHEPVEEDPPSGRDRRRSGDRDTSDCQRLRRLEDRQTA